MLYSVFVAYYLHQFRTPVVPANMQDRSPAYIREVHPRGNLNVEAQTPAQSSVAPGSQRIPMLRLRLEADCSGDVRVHSMALQRRGPGFNTDIERVYAVHRGRRVSRAKTIARKDGSFDLNFRNFSIAECQAEDVIVYVDFAENASAASQHRIELRSVDAGTSNVRTNLRRGNFLQAQSRTAGSAFGRSVSGEPVGSVAVEYRKLNRRVRYGNNRVLSRFTLAANSRHDQLLKSITFTNKGTATDEDLQNLCIAFRKRCVTAEIPSLTLDLAQFDFTPPFLLEKNQELLFELTADVKASRSRTIRFLIEEESDIHAVRSRGR